MKKAAAIIFVFISLCVSLFAQPKVAVLDALIDAKMDQSVVVPVTEKIIERFVVSGSYKVLDRSNVQQVLVEREFQLSGMVSDAEITQAGRFLGADYVVVPRVQLIADTYFLTCKMINVETGVIANQASTEGEGKLSILLGMAERVGATMSGAPVNGALAVQQLEAPQQTPAPSTAAPVKPAPAAAKPTVDPNRIGFRSYLGLGGGVHYMEYLTDYVDFESAGAELYALTSLWKGFIATAGFSYITELEYSNVGITTLSAGLGLGIPIGILMPWASVNFGIPTLSWDDMEDSFIGAEFSLDIGADVRLGSLLIALRYRMAYAAFADGYDNFLYFESNSFWLMAGLRL